MKRFGKSIFKGVKYAGLSIGAAALVGVDGIVPGFVLDVLTSSGLSGAIAVPLSALGTPFLAGAVMVALEQVRKHRDEVFAPKP